MCRSPSSSESTRSASVTMPTQRPPSLTTGTPGSSWLLSVRTTSSTLVSGETVTGSVSMMSATVAIARSLSAPAYTGTSAQDLANAPQVDHEDERLVGADHAARPALAVGEVRRDRD